MRNLIRTHHGGDCQERSYCQYAFVIGRSRRDDAIAAESDKFGDILQLDLVDSYNNLTLKSLAIVRYFNESSANFTHLLKLDDDCFLNIRALVSSLQEESSDNFIKGHKWKKVKPEARVE